MTSPKKKWPQSPLLSGLAVLVLLYLLFDNAFPPVMPQAIMVLYMSISTVAVLLYFSFDDERWEAFCSPFKSLVEDPKFRNVRLAILVLMPFVAAGFTYSLAKPSTEAPIELRQAHPAPPSTFNAFGKVFSIEGLENPIRLQVADLMERDPKQAWNLYRDQVRNGERVYFENCVFCHGEKLNGEGVYADGFNPKPTNFQDLGTIAQLEEGFLFWRIATGAAGLPKEGAPWDSAMPVWHKIIKEQEIWQVLLFMFDFVGQEPRIWDGNYSRAVASIKNQVKVERSNASGPEVYKQYCASCHGVQGQGDGIVADYLYPRPRDFSLGVFKYKTTAGNSPPSDADLLNTLRKGLPGTSMPGWTDILTDNQLKSLIPVIKRFDLSGTWEPSEVSDEDYDEDGFYIGEALLSFTELEPLDGQIKLTEESIARGQQVYLEVCSECHGDSGRGNITSGKPLEDEWGHRIWPRDLTLPSQWRMGDHSTTPIDKERRIQEIYRIVSMGIAGTPMPAHRAFQEGNEDAVSIQDRWHLANYVYTLSENAVKPRSSGLVNVIHMNDDLPDDPRDSKFQALSPTHIGLVPNVIGGERGFTQLNDMLTLRAARDDKKIALYVELNDRTLSHPDDETSQLLQDENWELAQDALALQLPVKGSYASAPIVEKPMYRHGDMRRSTHIWMHKVGQAIDDPSRSNALFIGKGWEQRPSEIQLPDGWSVKSSWNDGQWKILFTRPLKSEDGFVDFEQGAFIPISFASWDGSHGQVGSKHSVSSWFWLSLPKETSLKDEVAVPGVVFSVMLLVSLITGIRWRRKSVI